MIDSSEQGLTGIGQVPDNFCCMCKQVKEEVFMEQIQYPDHGGQNKVCYPCRGKLRDAIIKTLDSLGWPT